MHLFCVECCKTGRRAVGCTRPMRPTLRLADLHIAGLWSLAQTPRFFQPI